MPYTTIPDKTVGDVFTEAMWDLYVRDNQNYLWATIQNELAYAAWGAMPTTVIAIAGTTEAAATTIVSCPNVVLDGTPIWFDAFVPRTGGGDAVYYAFMDGVSQGPIHRQLSSYFGSIRARRRLTPAAGTHNFSLRATRVGASASALAEDGLGGNYARGWLRISKAIT